MKRDRFYKTIKITTLTGFAVSWLAIFFASSKFRDYTPEQILSISIVLLWVFNKIADFLRLQLRMYESDFFSEIFGQAYFPVGEPSISQAAVTPKILVDANSSEAYFEKLLETLNTSLAYIDQSLRVKQSLAFSFGDYFRDNQYFIDFCRNSHGSNYEEKTTEYIVQTLFGMPELQWKILSKKLPQNVEKTNLSGVKKTFSIHYLPHFRNNKLCLISVFVQDNSEYTEDRRTLENQADDLKKFFSILSIPDSVFDLFMDETSRIFNDLKRMTMLINSQSDIDQVYLVKILRLIHTLKANAGLFGFISIQKVTHNIEEVLLSTKQEKNNMTLDLIKNQINSLGEEIYSYQTLRREIFEFTNKREVAVEKYRLQWAKTLLTQLDYHVRRKELQNYNTLFMRCYDAIANLEKISLRDYLRRYDMMVAQIAEDNGKQVAKLKINLGIHLFDKRILFNLNDIIVHALRNAVTHGIESVESRLAAGKQPYGSIELRSYLDGDMICISVEDDGVGLKIDSIRDSLVGLGYDNKVLNMMKDEDVIECLFNSSVSTHKKVDLSAGRGIGLDVIKSYVQCLRGKVKLLRSSVGMKMEIKFPADLDDVIQPNGFHQITDLVKVNFIENFSDDKVHLTLHDQSLSGDLVLGNKQLLADIFKYISHYVIENPMLWDQIFLDIFKLSGKRKIDFDNVYRILIGVKGEGFSFDKQNKLINKAEYLAKKLGGSLIYRGVGLIELNIPSGFKNGNSVHNFEVVALKAYKPKLISGIEQFFSSQFYGWSYKLEWVEKLASAKLNGEGRIILTDIVSLNSDEGKSLRKDDSLIIINANEKDLEVLSQLKISPEQIFFYNTDEPSELLTRVISGLLVDRFDKQLSSAIALEDYKLAS